MATKKSVVDYLLTGKGDQNAANADYDPILKNMYTPRPMPKQLTESPFESLSFPPLSVPIKMNKPAAPFKKEQPPAIVPRRTTGIEIKAKSQTPPKLPWEKVGQQSSQALKRSEDAAKAMEKGAQSIIGAKRTDLTTPDFQKDLTPIKEGLPKYEEEVGKVSGELDKEIKSYDEQMKGFQEQEDAARATYKSRVDPLEMEMDELINNPPDIKAIDTGRFWRDTATGNKILLGISLAFSALTPEGIKNASQMVQDAIDRDVDAQKADNLFRERGYERKMTGVNNLLKHYQDKYNNERVAINATKAAQLSGAIAKVNMLTQGVTNKQSVLNAKKMVAELQTTASKYAYDAVAEKRKIEDASLNQTLTAIAQNVNAINDAAKMGLDRARLTETQLYHQGELELKKEELMLKKREEMPSLFDDKYAREIEYRIPSKDAKNKQAHEQLGTLREQFAVKKIIRDYFNKVMEIGPLGSGKGFLTDREVLKEAELHLFPSIKKIMDERFTDPDKKSLVDPMLPGRFTSKAELIQRRNALENLISSKHGDTSLVDSMGFRPRMQREFENLYQTEKQIRGQ